ncbi:MAG TPA: SRPBCC family protein [Candidatus Binataceae bacterium]|nr:SRPBCC family protein [Candidatus Binataceae bacterium]
MKSATSFDCSELVDLDRKTVSPRVFVEPSLYELEQERVFGHCWLFVGCESQIPEPGDFITNSMGEERVIVTRDTQGEIHVLVNSCRHRASRVCRIDYGNTRSFTCPYHGWTYDIAGKLVGVPRFKEAYDENFDRSEWGLLEVPRVETYRNLIFANFDPQAESLTSYLGNAKWYLDVIFDRTEGGPVALPGVHRWTVRGNWKVNSEQQCGDNYHPDFLHRSVLESGYLDVSEFRGTAPDRRDLEIKCGNGHGFMILTLGYTRNYPAEAVSYEAAVRAAAKRRLTPEQANLVNDGITYVANIFPNLSIIVTLGFASVRVNHPRSPLEHEIWSLTMVDKEAPQTVRDFARDQQNRTFSPSGIFEQDDGEMWMDASQSMRGFYRRRFPLYYGMGAGRGQTRPDRPGLTHPPNTEIGVFGFYERWRELMERGEVPR